MSEHDEVDRKLAKYLICTVEQLRSLESEVKATLKTSKDRTAAFACLSPLVQKHPAAFARLVPRQKMELATLEYWPFNIISASKHLAHKYPITV